MKNYKKIAAVACAAILAVSIGTGSLTSFASSIYKTYIKPQKIESIKAAETDMKAWLELKDQIDILTIENKEGEINSDIFGKIKFERNGELRNRLTSAGAKELVSFDFKAPRLKDKEMGDISVIPGKTFSITIGENINKALLAAGAKALPQKVIGKNITVKIPASAGGMYFFDHNWFYVSQTTAPEITSMDNIDINMLCSVVKELPLLPESIRTQIKNIDDLQNVLPMIFKENVTQIDLDGTKAYLCQIQEKKPIPADQLEKAQKGLKDEAKKRLGAVQPEINEIRWMKDGVIWNASGLIDQEEIVELAKELNN